MLCVQDVFADSAVDYPMHMTQPSKITLTEKIVHAEMAALSSTSLLVTRSLNEMPSKAHMKGAEFCLLGCVKGPGFAGI
ncbi:hypothetical protein DPMN_193618 [Dreissena polymorpha]|uniref:Uncharacterized protein n=1 Tax=Dreissena polymorpha TaxID=45954 RepID=A0A9D4BCG8_DREPO|nr:hypothetical protein DPMN_193618 [Dreissena polymorpha]